jgi:hypothetical protein
VSEGGELGRELEQVGSEVGGGRWEVGGETWDVGCGGGGRRCPAHNEVHISTLRARVSLEFFEVRKLRMSSRGNRYTCTWTLAF